MASQKRLLSFGQRLIWKACYMLWIIILLISSITVIFLLPSSNTSRIISTYFLWWGFPQWKASPNNDLLSCWSICCQAISTRWLFRFFNLNSLMVSSRKCDQGEQPQSEDDRQCVLIFLNQLDPKFPSGCGHHFFKDCVSTCAQSGDPCRLDEVNEVLCDLFLRGKFSVVWYF